MAEQIRPQPGREPLADALHQKALTALKGEARQHRQQHQADQAVDRLRCGHGLQPTPGGFTAQNADHLTNEQGLHGAGGCHRDQHGQCCGEPAPVAAQVGEQPPDPTQIAHGVAPLVSMA